MIPKRIILLSIFYQLIYIHANRIPTRVLYPTSPVSPKDISCHKITCYGSSGCSQTLPMMGREFRPSKKNIFFIESSCHGGLKSRQACVVESAAYANPNWQIVVLFAGPLKTQFWKSKSHSFLKSIPNLHFYRVNASKYAKGTPLEEIFSKDELSSSKYPVVHTSDLLRILTLYKYGGLYLDLDMIVVKSFDTLPKNFIPRESTKSLGSSIIAVSKNKIGKAFAEISIEDLATNYNPRTWSHNTINLYNRTLQNICQTNSLSKMNAKSCKGFHVLNHTWFYPTAWIDWPTYYIANSSMDVDNEAYTHHLWNSFGSQIALSRHSLLIKLAAKYCPKTYHLYEEKFGQ